MERNVFGELSFETLCIIFSQLTPETTVALLQVNKFFNKCIIDYLEKLNERCLFIPCHQCSNYVRVKLPHREEGNSIFLPPRIVSSSREMQIRIEIRSKGYHVSISNLRLILNEARDKSTKTSGYPNYLLAKDCVRKNIFQNYWLNVGVYKCTCLQTS